MMKLKDHQALIAETAQATDRYAQLGARFDAFREHAKALVRDRSQVQGITAIQEGEGFFELAVCGTKIRFSLRRSPRERAKGIIRVEDVSEEEPRQVFDVTFEGAEGETDIEPRDAIKGPLYIRVELPDDSIDIVLAAINAALNPVQQHPAR